MVSENADVASAAADEFRFRSSVKLVVGDGLLGSAHGTMMSPIGPLCSTSPVVGSSVVQPCTRSPVLVSRLPFSSTWKLPARV